MAGVNRVTKFERNRRVEKVFRWLLRGMGGPEIFQLTSQKEISVDGEVKVNENYWGVTERQIWNYIKMANRKWEKYADKLGERELGKAIARLSMLLRRALSSGHIRTALSIQREINEIMGFKVNKFEHSGRVAIDVAGIARAVKEQKGEE